MEYKLSDLLDHKNIMCHLFLSSLTSEQADIVASKSKGMTVEEADVRTVEIELFVDGMSVDPTRFFNKFNDQYELMVRQAAKELINGKFNEFIDKMQQMQEVVDMWSDQINWDVPNPFLKKDNSNKA